MSYLEAMNGTNFALDSPTSGPSDCEPSMRKRLQPGQVRDAILSFMHQQRGADASVSDIHAAVNKQLGDTVPSSSIRSYLRLTKKSFVRVGHGRYRLVRQ